MREIVDLQSLHSNNGSGPWYRYVSPFDGRRQDVAHRYLHPLLQSGRFPNLNVLVGNQVLQILLDNEKRAIGVEYRPNPAFATTKTADNTKTFAARKLVIASASSFGTPLLLERSEIGNPKVIKRAGVPVVESLCGVGDNFQGMLSSAYCSHLYGF